MSYDHFQPPEHFTRWQRFGYRALALALFGVGMYLFALFVIPPIDTYVATPLGDWTYETLRHWTGEPPRP